MDVKPVRRGRTSPRRSLWSRPLAPVRLNWLRAVRSAHGARYLAGGLALGVFLGCIPTFFIHVPIAWVIAALLRVSRLGAVVGVFISNPITAVPLYTFTFVVGQWMWPPAAGHVLADLGAILKDPVLLGTLGAPDLMRWMLGSSAVGILLGGLTFEGTRRWAKGYMARRDARRHRQHEGQAPSDVG